MKETANRNAGALDDDMPEELDLDWSEAKPNPFAGKTRPVVTVLLDPDVAKVFRTAEAVNKALRAIIDAMPLDEEERKAA